tara:strand:+ start:395 stop:1120 length:726 start_codon:yes stop_codon:yes gene_type:complete
MADISAGRKRKQFEGEAVTLAGLKRKQFEGEGDPGADPEPENEATRVARRKWQQEEGKEAAIEAVGLASRELGFDFSSESPHPLFTIEAATIEAATIKATTEYRNVLSTLVSKILYDIKTRWGIGSIMSSPASLMYAYNDLLGKAMTARAKDLILIVQMLQKTVNPITAWSAGRLLLRNLELGDESASLASYAREKMDDAAANVGFGVENEVYVYTGERVKQEPYAAWEDGDPDYPSLGVP